MRRLALTLGGLVVLAIAVLWPLVQFGTGGPADTDTTTITRYLADFRVADNGDLTVTETLTVHFPDYGKHGIFRFWDRNDPSAPHARRDPRDITVTMDGATEPFDQSRQSGWRYVVARIGDPNITVIPGDHTYTISYRIDGVLEPGTDGAQTQLYWNLIPGGWAQEIDHADLTVHLPAAASPVRCAVGAGKTGGCRVQGRGTRTLEVVTGQLAPRTPVTLKAGLPIATPARRHVSPVECASRPRPSATTCRSWSSYCCSRPSPARWAWWSRTARTSGSLRSRCSTRRPTAWGRPRRCTS